MTKEGWIILGLIALYFAWPALAFAVKLFFESLFAGLGVRTSGVVRRLSREPKQSPAPAFTAVRIKNRWRIKTADGQLMSWSFSTRQAAEKIIAEIKKETAA